MRLERPHLFTAVVSNTSQISGLSSLRTRPLISEPERHVRVKAILTNSGANIQHTPGDCICYQPNTDSTTLPEHNQFPTADAYYAATPHELDYWTGHSLRFDYGLSHPFGSEGHTHEEPCTEIASLTLGECFDVGHDPGQHATYVDSWIKALKEGPKETFQAIADAEYTAGYVMGFEQGQAQLIERQPVQQANDLPARQEREPVTSQGLPQAQGALVSLAWCYAVCEEFGKEMAVRIDGPNYSRTRELVHAPNKYNEMGFEPPPYEQAVLAERRPAMDETAQWIRQNVLLNLVVKGRVYETVRSLDHCTDDISDDKKRHEYFARTEGKRRIRDARQGRQACTVQGRHTVPENTAQHVGQQAVYV